MLLLTEADIEKKNRTESNLCNYSFLAWKKVQNTIPITLQSDFNMKQPTPTVWAKVVLASCRCYVYTYDLDFKHKESYRFLTVLSMIIRSSKYI